MDNGMIEVNMWIWEVWFDNGFGVRIAAEDIRDALLKARIELNTTREPVNCERVSFTGTHLRKA